MKATPSTTATTVETSRRLCSHSERSVVRNMATFLATRIIYAGAGKVGIEERGAVFCPYQLSQRADFFSTLQSVDTLHNRPLVNTRDEAHGDARRYRRLHVIAGDANMSEYATALRVGTMNLVIALIESGWQTPVALKNPVQAIKSVSRDQSYRWIVESEDGSTIGAVDVQRAYLRAARELQLPGSDWVLDEWQSTLDTLEVEPMSLFNQLDWVAKKSLLEQFAEAEELIWQRDVETLQSLDLAYHNVDPDESLYYGLVESGAMETLVSESEIEAARCEAPNQTRAALRGLLVRRFGDKIRAASWGAMLLEENGEKWSLSLSEDHNDYPELCRRLEACSTLREVAALLREE